MENERVLEMLLEFSTGRKMADVVLRSKNFSNDEISQVENLGYINCFETTAWGDRLYKITKDGDLLVSKDAI